MFFGNYEYQIDEKGRLSVPSKFRDELGLTAYILKGYDGCISVYKETEFEKYITKLQNLPYESQKARLHQRILLGSVEKLSIDKQGRMLIPSKIIKQYNLNKEIIILGVLDHFEIWDREKYSKYISDNEEGFETNAEELLKNEE